MSNIFLPSGFSAIPNYARTGFYGGNGIVTGHTKVGNVPVSCLVSILEHVSLDRVDFTRSSITGEYFFKNLNKSIQYTVIAIDYDKNYNDVIAARVMAV